MRTLRGRMLRLGVGAAAVVAILIVAQQDLATTVLAVSGLAVAGLLWLWLRRPAVAASILSLVVTCVLISEITHWIGAQLNSVGPAQVGIVFWIFAFVIVAATGLTQGSGRGAALTVVVAHAVLVVASFAAYLQTAIVPVVAFVVAIAIVTLRARQAQRSRRRVDDLTLETLSRNAILRGAERTRDALQTGTSDARLVGPVQLNAGLEIEHVVLHDDRTYVVETRAWEGRVERVRLARKGKVVAEAYGLDEDVRELAARTEPVLRAAQAFAEHFGLSNVVAVVALWDVELGEQVVEMRAAESKRILGPARTYPTTYLVKGEHLAEWIRTEAG